MKQKSNVTVVREGECAVCSKPVGSAGVRLYGGAVVHERCLKRVALTARRKEGVISPPSQAEVLQAILRAQDHLHELTQQREQKLPSCDQEMDSVKVTI